MKKNILKSLMNVMPAILLGITTLSCDDMFELKPEVSLDRSQMYQNRFDADAAVIGVYGKLMNLAEKQLVLNELRGDLVNLTENAGGNADLLSINYHNVPVGTENQYADPTPYYEVVLAANDVLKNLQVMLAENKLDSAEYIYRYSDVGAIRSWVYLQLGIQYNTIPYITSPLETVEELKSVLKNRYDLNVSLTDGSLLDSLINFTTSLPTYDNYGGQSSLLEGLNSDKYFINKNILLGDLYLWNNDYTMAAAHYKVIMDNTGDYARYKVAWLGRFSHLSGFETIAPNDNEWIWAIPFNPDYQPVNPFIELFSNVGGSYLLRPSERILEMWEREVTTGGDPDPRRFASVEYVNRQPLVRKYLFNFRPTDPYQKPGTWFLNRAAGIHLRYAEAANRDGYHKIAFALLNNGIKPNYDPDPDGGDNRDIRDVQQTHQPFPYNFDARFTRLFGTIRGPYFANLGIRNRAGLPNVNFQFVSDSMPALEEAIIREAALELAFEGNRWSDLLRVALRQKDPEFLAEKVYQKFVEAEDPRADEVRTRLMDPANWFLPFRWE